MSAVTVCTRRRSRAGCSRSGLPYSSVGYGPRPLVVLPGLFFEDKPLDRLTVQTMLGDCRGLVGACTLFVVGRRSGLQRGCSMADRTSDYAATIDVAFGGPVDLLGTSTGGSIALRFAADHPHLVRRHVVHSAACRLGSAGKAVQRLAAQHARRGEWR